MLLAIGMPGLPELIILAVLGLFCVAAPVAIVVLAIVLTKNRE